jgi:hypothetical protein
VLVAVKNKFAADENMFSVGRSKPQALRFLGLGLGFQRAILNFIPGPQG